MSVMGMQLSDTDLLFFVKQEAVDEARTGLTAPMSTLFYGKQMEHASEILMDAAKKKHHGELGASSL